MPVKHIAQVLCALGFGEWYDHRPRGETINDVKQSIMTMCVCGNPRQQVQCDMTKWMVRNRQWVQQSLRVRHDLVSKEVGITGE